MIGKQRREVEKEATCEGCRFWHIRTVEAFDGKFGNCRRYPPALSSCLKETGERVYGIIEQWQISVHPTTASFQWCGEWKE